MDETLSRMIKPILVAVALGSFAALSVGCTETVYVQEPAPRARARMHAPFRGTYHKVAEGTYKNGRRYPVANSNGTATLRVERGRVVYDQTYLTSSGVHRVVQVYTYGPGSVAPIGGDGYDVALVFQSMSGDTAHYNPDALHPKLEVHRTAVGWDVALFTTDTRGIVGVVEFQ